MSDRKRKALRHYYSRKVQKYDFPDEVWIEIMLYLDCRSLSKMQRLCWRFNKLGYDSKLHQWKNITDSTIGKIPPQKQHCLLLKLSKMQQTVTIGLSCDIVTSRIRYSVCNIAAGLLNVQSLDICLDLFLDVEDILATVSTLTQLRHFGGHSNRNRWVELSYMNNKYRHMMGKPIFGDMGRLKSIRLSQISIENLFNTLYYIADLDTLEHLAVKAECNAIDLDLFHNLRTIDLQCKNIERMLKFQSTLESLSINMESTGSVINLQLVDACNLKHLKLHAKSATLFGLRNVNLVSRYENLTCLDLCGIWNIDKQTFVQIIARAKDIRILKLFGCANVDDYCIIRALEREHLEELDIRETRVKHVITRISTLSPHLKKLSIGTASGYLPHVLQDSESERLDSQHLTYNVEEQQLQSLSGMSELTHLVVLSATYTGNSFPFSGWKSLKVMDLTGCVRLDCGNVHHASYKRSLGGLQKITYIYPQRPQSLEKCTHIEHLK